jgi:hypothetical protein
MQVLVQLHADVMPHVMNPHLLADFFAGVVDQGGLLGILALHGLFVLVTKHGFEYPQFYARLYAMLEPSAFLVRPFSGSAHVYFLFVGMHSCADCHAPKREGLDFRLPTIKGFHVSRMQGVAWGNDDCAMVVGNCRAPRWFNASLTEHRLRVVPTKLGECISLWLVSRVLL